MAWWKDVRELRSPLWIFLLACALSPSARADDAADMKAAREAYDRGARAFGQKSYAVAAAELARADELRPDPSALEAALKAAVLAEDPVLSMTLVERAAARPTTAGLAAQVTVARERFADKVARMSVSCAAPCSAKVGDAAVPTGVTRYYRAGNHVIEITAGAAAEVFAVQLPAGANLEWRPPAKAPPSSASAASSTAPGLATAAPLASSPALGSAASSLLAPPPRITPAPAAPTASRLSPVWFGVGVGVTTIAAGVTVASGIDTLHRHDAFLLHRTDAGAADGRAAELRTNLLLGATVATALLTAVAGYFAFRAPREAPATR